MHMTLTGLANKTAICRMFNLEKPNLREPNFLNQILTASNTSFNLSSIYYSYNPTSIARKSQLLLLPPLLLTRPHTPSCLEQHPSDFPRTKTYPTPPGAYAQVCKVQALCPPLACTVLVCRLLRSWGRRRMGR